MLVIGLGVMGMLHLLAFKALGAGRIIGADMVPYRLAKALQLGATDVIDASKMPTPEALRELTSGRMADIVIVGPNSAGALEDGLSCAAPGGTVVMFTPVRPGEKITLDPNELYFRDVSLVTSYSTGPAETRAALGLIERGAVRAEMVVTHRFALERTAEAYRITAVAGESLKCLVIF